MNAPAALPVHHKDAVAARSRFDAHSIARAARWFAATNYRRALREYTRIARRGGVSATLIAYRADCLRELGKLSAACALYRRALQRQPDLLHAHANLGPLLLLLGETEAALQHCARASTLDPGSALAWMNLAHAQVQLEQFDAAMLAYAEAYALAPESSELCCCIADAWRQVGDLEQATLWLQRAGALTPDSARVIRGLAAVLLEGEQSAAAASLLAPLCTAHPDDADAALEYARAVWDEGDADAALTALRRAAELQPQLAHIHCRIADVLLSTGDLTGAEQAQRRALALNPRCIGALAGLATGLRGALAQADAEATEALLHRPGLRDGARSALHTGLAHYYDGRGDYARAAEHAARGNRSYWAHRVRRGWSYDPAAHAAQIDRTIATFTPMLFARLAGAGDDDPRPTFIVGMPRSGTTLTETILARHPQILGIGERTFAARSLQQVCDRVGMAHSPLAALAELDGSGLRAIARDYQQTLQPLIERRPHGSIDVARVLDKMPDNYELLGWIALLFPRARIIHVQRDPRDIAVSCWMQRFGQVRWACDMQHIAERLVQHRRMMAHWRRVLPIEMFEFDYATLVTNPESMTRRLLDFVGLPWHDACLAPTRYPGIVRTASVSQVRRAVYTSSVARWKHYTAVLGPVLAHFPAAPA